MMIIRKIEELTQVYDVEVITYYFVWPDEYPSDLFFSDTIEGEKYICDKHNNDYLFFIILDYLWYR